MQKLTLDDFEFGQFNHCFNYGDYSLEPGFGGFAIYFKDKPISQKRYSQEEAIKIVSDYYKDSIDGLKGEEEHLAINQEEKDGSEIL